MTNNTAFSPITDADECVRLAKAAMRLVSPLMQGNYDHDGIEWSLVEHLRQVGPFDAARLVAREFSAEELAIVEGAGGDPYDERTVREAEARRTVLQAALAAAINVARSA